MKHIALLLVLLLTGCETFSTKVIVLDPPAVLMAPPLDLHTIKKTEDDEQQ